MVFIYLFFNFYVDFYLSGALIFKVTIVLSLQTIGKILEVLLQK